MMHLRRATPADAQAIATIHVRSWQASYAGIVPEAYLQSLSIEAREAVWRQTLGEATPEVFVAEESQCVSGWISVGRSRDQDAHASTGELWAIYVAPDCWGQGIGRALWERGKSSLQTAAFTEVTLWVLKDNHRAVAFYSAIGFVHDVGHDKLIELGGKPLVEIRLRCRLDDRA